MTDLKPPFSFPVEVLQLPSNGRVYTLSADVRERAAVAAHLKIVAVGRLTATITLMPTAGGGVDVSGHFEADIMQSCVVSLQPVAATLRDEIARRFVLPARKVPAAPGAKASVPEESSEGWIDPLEEVPDPIIDGSIDLGDVVVEELSLAIDPYPRAPGVVFAGLDASDSAPSPEPAGPFAALAGFQPAAPAQRRSKTRPKARR